MEFREILDHQHSSARGSIPRDTLRTTTVLLALVFVGAPLLTSVIRVLPFPIPESEFVALVIVGSIYGAYLLYSQNLIIGLVTSLFVLMTVRVNVPLGPAEMLLGGIGPNVWVVHIPMIGLIAYYVLDEGFPSLHLAHHLFFGFVAWSVLTAFFGHGPRPDMAIWFSIWVFQAGIVFVLASWIIADNLISFRTGLSVVVLTTITHSLLGVLQFFNGGSLGFPHLGESGRKAVGTISLPLLGTNPIGPFVNGFTYGGPLAVLITITFPVTIVLAIRTKGHTRTGFIIATLLLVFIQRVTGWDAARGAIIFGVIVLAIATAWWCRDLIDQLEQKARPAVSAGAVTIIWVGTILFPSSESGSTSTYAGSPPPTTTTHNGSSSSTITTHNGSSSSATTTTSASTSSSASTPDQSVDAYLSSVDTISIPLFDASNLGIRLQQYLVAVDITSTYPLFGIGGANFYYISDDIGFKTNYFMHSMYFEVLVETGLPGFLLYVGTLCAIILAGWSALHRESTDTLLVVGVIAGLLGGMAHFFWNPQMTRLAAFFPFWAVAGLLVGYARK